MNKFDEQKNDEEDNAGKNALPPVHPFVIGSEGDHRGLPSSRNCAWPFAVICGVPISN